MSIPTSTASGDDTKSSGRKGGNKLAVHRRPKEDSDNEPGHATTEETKGDEEQTEGSDELTKWFHHFGLNTVADAVKEAGLDEYNAIKELDEDIIQDMIQDANLNKLKAKLFRKAINAVKDGKYPAAPPKQEPAKKEDPWSNLRESRKEYKGIVQLQVDGLEEDEKEGQTAAKKLVRTVIFIGQTGSGKTTLINSMCNYLQCVDYDEPFRYALIMEEKDDALKEKTKDKTESQTQSITKYHLRDLPAVPFSLNIIDTPGFGDTEGPEQDKKIQAKFKKFFEGEDRIDAIYFVVKHSETRLGAVQKYIFNMVLNLFGQDVKDNIFILFTFSDGAEPPALAAVKKLEVPYKEYFQINNSGFHLLTAGKQNRTHRMFFELGIEQFKTIFDELGQIAAVSTKLTRETLKERDEITNKLLQIGQQLTAALNEIDTMHEMQEYIKANEKKIKENADFVFEVEEWQNVQVPKPHNWYTTYCTICDRTCCTLCWQSDSKDWCWMMKGGNCTVCPKKCKVSAHVHKDYIIERKKVKVKKDNEQMKASLGMAKHEKASYEAMVQASINNVDQAKQDIMRTIDLMKKSKERLSEIALNKTVLTEDQYYDTLIQTEKDEAKDGWQKRVKALEGLKTQNKLLRDVDTKGADEFLQEKLGSSAKLRQKYGQKVPKAPKSSTKTVTTTKQKKVEKPGFFGKQQVHVVTETETVTVTTESSEYE